MDPVERQNRNRIQHAARRAALRAEREQIQNLPWYIKAQNAVGTYREKRWNRTCRWCRCTLLEGETEGWCCNKGTKILPFLTRYPLELHALQIYPQLSNLSLRLNRLFTFSVTGVARDYGNAGEWAHPGGPATVILGGRTYHRMLPLGRENHPVHWLLYDGQARLANAAEQEVPPEMVNHVLEVLTRVNPYINIFRRWGLDAPENVSLEIIGRREYPEPTQFLTIYRK